MNVYPMNAESQAYLDNHRSIGFALTILKAVREAYAHGLLDVFQVSRCEQVWDSIPDDALWSLN
jgi:hypothetical protein